MMRSMNDAGYLKQLKKAKTFLYVKSVFGNAETIRKL